MTPASSRSPEPDPDADVLALLDRGKVEVALHWLLRRHGAAIAGFCREALGDRPSAEDVLQQIFVEAFRDLGRFRRSSTVRAWLFGIARHRVLDAVKARRRAWARIEQSDGLELADGHPSASASLDEAALQAALIACVRELDGPIRRALLLRYQEGSPTKRWRCCAARSRARSRRA